MDTKTSLALMRLFVKTFLTDEEATQFYENLDTEEVYSKVLVRPPSYCR